MKQRTKPVFTAGSYVGAAVVLLMAIMTVADVTGRYVFNAPVQGVFELTGLMLSIIAACGIAATTWADEHIMVDALYERLSSPQQRIMIIVSAFLSLFIFAILSWQGVISVIGAIIPYYDKTTGIPGFVTYPFRIILVLGFVLSVVAAMGQILDATRQRTGFTGGPNQLL